MPDTSRPTIFALSSGRPPAAIAVIRMSGSRAGEALTALGVKIPEPRKASLARIRDQNSLDANEIIDEALALWFPAPNSETGEDTAELQLHGGRAVIAGVLDALSRLDGLRMAEPGEFTRRAFENGKLDLTAVEGLADLVGAETQGQRRQAFRQMKGLLGNRAETWRQRLIQALALVEARIDFSDEGDVPDNLVSPALAIARELADEIAAALADGGRGERLREGLVVAIAGPPNAGKSTLLNRLAQREAAIVSPYAGTTRDVIEVHLELAGMPVTLLDTAGIRETDDPVEMEGVRRARDRAAGADLVLWVVDATGGSMADRSLDISGRSTAASPESITPVRDDGFGAQPSGMVRKDGNYSTGLAAVTAPPLWLVFNKVDLIQTNSCNSESLHQDDTTSELDVRFNNPLKDIINFGLRDKNEAKLGTNALLTDVVNQQLTGKNDLALDNNDIRFNLSATSGQGFGVLLDALARHAKEFLAGAESSLVTRTRHREVLSETLAALRRALEAAPGGALAGHDDLLAEELRLAAGALGRLTGRVDVEDILDVIFRDFCIGK